MSSDGYWATPRRHLATGFGNDPFSEIGDESGLLGHVDEVSRHQEAPNRMIPPDKCFHREQATAAKIHFGLIVQE